MIVRREGIPGPDTPEGLLTRFNGTFVGDLTDLVDRDPNALCVELGLSLLEMDERTIINISRLVRKMYVDSVKTGKSHDFTVPFENRSSGLTIHCNAYPNPIARASLREHCKRRKYSQRAKQWIGLVLMPRSGEVRFGEYLRAPHAFDYHLEAMMAGAPPLVKFKDVKLSSGRSQRVGRNSPCTCGSGQKYKRCCGA